jgi:hypothetical protein
MNQFDANGHSNQQKGENFSLSPKKDDCRIQETPTVDESSELYQFKQSSGQIGHPR